MYVHLKYSTSNWIAATFVKLVLLIRRGNGLKCRACGLEVPVPDVVRFTEDGCLACGCKKLGVIK
jgi:hypothetical protein